MTPPLSINHKTKPIWLNLLYKKVDKCPPSFKKIDSVVASIQGY